VLGRFALAVAAGALLSGCALGQRPTVTDRGKPDDRAVEAVLSLLAEAPAVTFTATYTIMPAAVDIGPVTAVVVHDGSAPGGQTRVTIGDVVYIDDGGEQRTCAAGGECVAGYDEARVSNLSVTSAFWGSSAARRLGTDAGRDIAEAVGTEAAIAGQAATCVTLALDGANAGYCALQTGPLARQAGNDVAIELTEFALTVDPAAFG